MIKKNIKFITTGQFVTFYNTCKGFSSDVRVRDLENQHLDINAKKTFRTRNNSTWTSLCTDHSR